MTIISRLQNMKINAFNSSNFSSSNATIHKKWKTSLTRLWPSSTEKSIYMLAFQCLFSNLIIFSMGFLSGNALVFLNQSTKGTLSFRRKKQGKYLANYQIMCMNLLFFNKILLIAGKRQCLDMKSMLYIK